MPKKATPRQMKLALALPLPLAVAVAVALALALTLTLALTWPSAAVLPAAALSAAAFSFAAFSALREDFCRRAGKHSGYSFVISQSSALASAKARRAEGG